MDVFVVQTELPHHPEGSRQIPPIVKGIIYAVLLRLEPEAVLSATKNGAFLNGRFCLSRNFQGVLYATILVYEKCCIILSRRFNFQEPHNFKISRI